MQSKLFKRLLSTLMVFSVSLSFSLPTPLSQSNQNLAPVTLPAFKQVTPAAVKVDEFVFKGPLLEPTISLTSEKVHVAHELPFEVDEDAVGLDGLLARLETHFNLYRGENWFNSFYRGHRIFYLRTSNYLLEYRVVTSDMESLLEGEALFDNPDRHEMISPAIELKAYALNSDRENRFGVIVEEAVEGSVFNYAENGDSRREGQYFLLRNGSSVERENLPEPLREIPFKDARDLGNGIRALIPLSKKPFRTIYFYQEETGLALKLVYKGDRVLSYPLFATPTEHRKEEYAQLLYNVLAKVHNFSARTPIIWDPLLSSYAGKKDPAGIDLPELVQILHKKRGTVPPKPEIQDFITEVKRESRSVALLYDVKDSLSPTLLARMKESPNVAPKMIVGTTPYALKVNLDHADYEELYKDIDYVEIDDKKVGTYGYLILNGQKVWVFKNMKQLGQLKQTGTIASDIGDIDALVGGNFQVQTESTDDGNREILFTRESRELESVLDQTGGSIRTYSNMDLFSRNAPYRTVVDPQFNGGKIETAAPNLRHFKAPDTSRRAGSRLINGLRSESDFHVLSVRAIRVRAQLRNKAQPLDASNRHGHQNVIVPFTGAQEDHVASRFTDYFNDFGKYTPGNEVNIDTVQGEMVSDRTASKMEMTLEVGAEQELSVEDVQKTLRQLADGPLKGYLHLYDHQIMGKHVRKQPGVHISLKDGTKVHPIKNSNKHLHKVHLHVWYDADWERAGAIWELVDSFGFRGRRPGDLPEGTELESKRDKVRDFLFERGTIPTARRVFPYVEFAPEPAVGILQAPTGRIGRVAIGALMQNVVNEEMKRLNLPDYQVGNFNVRFAEIVGPGSIKDVVVPYSADGTYGKLDADIKWGLVVPSEEEFDRDDIDFDKVLAWMTINGSEKIYFIQGRGERGYLNPDEIPYGASFPLAGLSANQTNNYFLFTASGSLLDDVDTATTSGVIKKALIPAPYKKVKPAEEAKKDDTDPTKRRLFVYHLSDVRNMWKTGRLFSPGSCTTNCGIFSLFMNEVLYNLPAMKKAGIGLLNKRVQRAIRERFNTFWDDFPEDWRKDKSLPIRFKLFENGKAVTNHAVTNTQPARNEHTDSESASKADDVKKKGNGGMNLTSSGVTKAVSWVLPGARKVETDSLRVQQSTGSNFALSQSVAMYNVRTDTPDAELKKYLERKVLEAIHYASDYLFQGSFKVSPPNELMNADAIRRDPITSVFDEGRLRLEMQLDEDAVRFRQETVVWYDNEWGFTSQVLGLLSELALSMGEEDADNNGTDPIEWLPGSPEGDLLEAATRSAQAFASAI